VNAKYRIKNNNSDPVSLFLSTTKNNRASTKERSSFIPSAISVAKTLVSGFFPAPRKKTIREASAAKANPPVSSSSPLPGSMEGRAALTTEISIKNMAVRSSNENRFFIGTGKVIPVISFGVAVYPDWLTGAICF
jgi:hypothetical protein